MQQSGFRSAPVSKSLLYLIVTSSLLASIADIKHYFHIQILPHIWLYRQVWRVGIWQTIYANAGELLFASMVLYHLRIIERLFGPHKYISFLVYTYLLTSILVPVLSAVVFTLTGSLNYIPPGPTPVIFAALAQYHAVVPSVYKFQVATSIFSSKTPSSSAERSEEEEEETMDVVTLTDKFYVYLLATQLALCQPPGSLFAAAVGWIVGYAWRMEMLPRSRWRLPAWAWKSGSAGEFENLRRRLREGEGVEDGAPGQGQGQPEGQRPLMRLVFDQFRGAF
ncbi:hypothetical protein RUND412_003045 [Rhizina undulata]